MIELHYSTEVADARANGAPIVALESTIITHGMPYPQNLETARLVEETVRSAGATPATIAVISSKLHIGLEAEMLDQLAQAQHVAKLSRADLPVIMAQGRTGATTVAATMIAAQLAKIDVFATGGIGGVHRGAEDSFDISADLGELAQTSVTVVCAGAKAILDIPKTFEYLETLGVPVITYRADDIPAFWSASSGIATPLRMDDADAIARALRMRRALGLQGGQLICNPLPVEAEIPRAELIPIIDQALGEADEQKITAKDVTPFLLARIFELTDGKSLEANIALIQNNARLAAQIAKAV